MTSSTDTEQGSVDMELDLLPLKLAVARYEPGADLPQSVTGSEWSCVTRTRDELSVVCPEAALPENAQGERGWRALKVRGPLPFDQVGIMAALSGCLAEAGVPIFAISTYDTDYLLVKEDRIRRALRALRAAGHQVHPS